MKVKVVQIVWHNKEPVFTVDFHPSGLLATGGADGEIKLWKLGGAGQEPMGVTFLESVTGDKFDTGLKTWNCVRFCPTGQSLAAAGDMGQIYVFRPNEGGATEGLSRSAWKATNCGAYSGEDVVDLCWAADGSGFVTASNDMTCMFWDPEAKAGKAKLRLEGHRLYVQGVAWDPHNQFIVSQGADRSCRVYSMRQAVPGVKRKAPAAHKRSVDRLEGLYCAHVINKSIPKGAGTGGKPAGVDKPSKKPGGQHLFHDESLNTFFRRLAWSPDGSLLVVPAGLRKAEEGGQPSSVAHVFARGCWQAPLLQLPVSPKPAVAVRFCPVLFELEPVEPGAAVLPIELPYRMVFALATKDSVILQDTQVAQPLAVLAGLHLEVITDLAWSIDGRVLAISSYDSYCSLACFEEGELGRPMQPDSLPVHIRDCLWSSAARPACRREPVSATKRIPSAKKAAAGAGRARDTPIYSEAEAPMPAVGEGSGAGVPQVSSSQPPAISAARNEGTGLSGFKRARRIAPVLVQAAPVAQLDAGNANAAPMSGSVGENGEPKGQKVSELSSIAAAAAAAGRAAARQ